MSVFEAKFWKKSYSTLNSRPAILTHFPHLFFQKCVKLFRSRPLRSGESSILSGTFPQSLKTAVVKPLLKKSNLGNTILSNYRRISNLPFIGKIIEKVVLKSAEQLLKLKWIPGQFSIWFPSASQHRDSTH